MLQSTSPTALPQILDCRWYWCPKSFRTREQLVQHVIDDHVNTTRPIRRNELKDLMRAEEGIGESMSMHLPSYLSQTTSVNGGKAVRFDTNRPVEPSASLPSPPRSDKSPQVPTLDFPVADYSPKDNVNESREHDFFATPSSERFFKAQDDDPPSFASLDSPIKLQMTSLPQSPDMDTLIYAGRSKKRKARDLDNEPMNRRVFLPTSDSIDSHTSSASMQAIEEELTQSLDSDDEEVDLGKYIHTEQLEDLSAFELGTEFGSQAYAGEIFRPQAHSTQVPPSQGLIIALEHHSRAESVIVASQNSTSSWTDQSSSNDKPPPPAQPPRAPSSFLQLGSQNETSQSLPTSPIHFSSLASNPPQQVVVDESSPKFTLHAHNAETNHAVFQTSSANNKPQQGFGFGRMSVNYDSPPPPPRLQRKASRRGKVLHRASYRPPAPPPAAPISLQSVPKQRVQPMNDEDEQSQESYPPLQTQAPYESQPMGYE